LAAFTELTIEKGATFSTTITVEDTNGDAINLTGYTANSQIRKSYYSTTANNFTATVTGIANGEITLSMTAANTSNLTNGRALYDLLITAPNGTKTRVVEGIVTILPNITTI
jgi:hypothetical protein